MILTVLRTENQKPAKPICNYQGLLRDPNSAPQKKSKTRKTNHHN